MIIANSLFKRLMSSIKSRIWRVYKLQKKIRSWRRAQWYRIKWSYRLRGQTYDQQFCNQTLIRYRSTIALPLDRRDLEAALVKHNIYYNKGAFAILVYKRSDVARIAPQIASDYEKHNFALKIFLSDEFTAENDALYVTKKLHNTLEEIVMRSTPSIRETAVISNYLAVSINIPRVYDTSILEADSTRYMIQIVEYIPDSSYNPHKAETLIASIKANLKMHELALSGHVRGWDHKDFDPSQNYNGNIRSLNDEPYYVDGQRFKWIHQRVTLRRILDELNDVAHFGREQEVFGGRFLYQSVDMFKSIGRRDIALRQVRIDEALEKVGFSYKHAQVLDIGCNIAQFLLHALDKGAFWCTGIDREQIIINTKKLIYGMGYSRIDLYATDLTNDTNHVIASGKKYDLILFLAISSHIGQPSWLSKLDYRFLVYEGHQHQTIEHACDYLSNSPIKYQELKPIGLFADGDTGARPIVIAIN